MGGKLRTDGWERLEGRTTYNFVRITHQTKDMKPQRPETYTIKVYCSNCGNGEFFGLEMEVPKGEKAADYLYYQRCTNCGCKTLIHKN